MYAQDTIVAPATPPGMGAVAIVRLSGPRAIAILHEIWTPLAPATIRPRRLILGDIRDPVSGAVLDRAMAVVMPGPRSLTGEDVAELQCHGGTYLIRRLVGLALARGARMAEPGEFSRRAFLNGRIDLTQAEAVAELVEAGSERALAQALDQLTGALAERVGGLRREVIGLRAHLEAEIDFSDEDLKLPTRGEMAEAIARLRAEIALLHDSFARGRLMRSGARAAIVGKPNVGKSSVLNLLLGVERAIVTPIAGTTRDVIEDTVQLGPWALVLQDTAGLRGGADQVEKIGIERTLAHAAQADLVIAVLDSSRPLDADDRRVIAICRERAGVALLNKRDLPQHWGAADLRAEGLRMPLLPFVAIRAESAAPLREELVHALETLAGPAGGDTLAISRERHHQALAAALRSLDAARASAVAKMPPEIVAVDVAAAADALGSITGEVSSEDVLDAIFREFCIGK